jgi:alpha-D-xyloside xylohydrolase
MKKKIALLVLLLVFVCYNKSFGQLQGFDLLNTPIDVSNDFRSFENTFYLADSLTNFDPKTASGQIIYRRYEYATGRHLIIY